MATDITDSQTNLVPTTVIDEEPELTTDVDVTQLNNKNYFSSLCIKFSKGYKSYTILQLSSLSINIFSLSLPIILMYLGVVEGLLVYVFISLLSFYTMTLMLEMIIKTNPISYYFFLYYNISKNVSYFYEVFNFLFLGIKIMIIEFFSITFTIEVFNTYLTNKMSGILPKVIIAAVFCICIQFPLSIKTFDIYQILAQFMTMIVVIITLGFMCVLMLIDVKNIQSKDILIFEEANWGVLYALGLLILLFNSHNNLIISFKSFNMKTKRRSNKVIFIYFLITLFFFISFAIIGHFLVLAKHPLQYNTIILLLSQSYQASNISKILYTILKILFIISIQFVISTDIAKIKEEIKLITHTQLTKLKEVLIAIGVLIVTNAVSIFVKNILTLFSISGGICSCIISFTIPCYAYKKLIIGNSFRQLINYAIMFCSVILGGFITVYGFVDCASIKPNI